MPPKKPQNYEVGDLVFAKVKGYPPWPARIEAEPPVGYKAGPGRYPVFFFGTYESAVVSAKDLFPYDRHKHKLGIQRKVKNFNEGLNEIENNPTIVVSVGVESEPMDIEPEEPIKDQSLEDEADEDGEEVDKTVDENPVKSVDSESKPLDSPPLLTAEEPTEPVVRNESEEVDPIRPQLMVSDSEDEERKLIIDDQIASTSKKRRKEPTPKESVKKKTNKSEKRDKNEKKDKKERKESKEVKEVKVTKETKEKSVDNNSGANSKKKEKKNEKVAKPVEKASASKPAEKPSAGRPHKRKRVILDDSSDSDVDKLVDKVIKKDSDEDNQKTTPKDKTSDDLSSDEEVVSSKSSRKRKKEKQKSKLKDEKRHKKEHKSKDHKESDHKETAATVSTESTTAAPVEDPEVVEKLRLKLQKDKEKEFQQKLQEKEKEKERRKQEKKEQKRKEKLEKSAKVPPPVTEVLTTIDNDIKDALSKDNANVDRCLDAMERLKSVQVTPQGLQGYGTELKALIMTLKKCRKYKTDERVRQKSDHLYHKFKDFFYTNDSTEITDSLSLTTSSSADSEPNESKDQNLVTSTVGAINATEIDVKTNDVSSSGADTKAEEPKANAEPNESTATTTTKAESPEAPAVRTTAQNSDNSQIKNGLSSTTPTADDSAPNQSTDKSAVVPEPNNSENNGLVSDAQSPQKKTIEDKSQNGCPTTTTTTTAAKADEAVPLPTKDTTTKVEDSLLNSCGPKRKRCLVM